MKFLRKIKPSKVLGGKYASPTVQGAMVRVEVIPTRVPGGGPKEMEDREHLVLFATDGWGAVRIDLGVKDAADAPGPLPPEALKHLERGVSAEIGEAEVRAGYTRYDRVMGDFPHHDAKGEKFPEWEELIETAGLSEPRGEHHLTLNVNPRLLLQVAEAIGEPENVVLTFDLRKVTEYPGMKKRWYSGGMKVSPPSEQVVQPADALLMPIRPRGS